ncbi:hypothetical protein M569_16763 [Genlisea aurea]|uniref:Uncharacterized protein n=1 Tax=Genlisea aurea TaxID=192259 RepID=S8D5Z4_9LAMI|nr:hypothetical protein M569_16763 [Genlisea aurea]
MASGRAEKELSGLRSELDRILYLLRVADPTGEASRKRESSSSSSSSTAVGKDEKSKPPSPPKEVDPEPEGATPENAAAATTATATVFTAAKPQWLGAVEEDRIKPPETAPPTDTQETDEEFVDYKDRKEILTKSSSDDHRPSSLEEAGPGLLIRKRKSIPPPDSNAASADIRDSEFKAEDAVALLLRHSRGYHEWEDDEDDDDSNGLQKPKKRVIGPERPSSSSSSSSSLRVSTDYDSWGNPETDVPRSTNDSDTEMQQKKQKPPIDL